MRSKFCGIEKKNLKMSLFTLVIFILWKRTFRQVFFINQLNWLLLSFRVFGILIRSQYFLARYLKAVVVQSTCLIRKLNALFFQKIIYLPNKFSFLKVIWLCLLSSYWWYYCRFGIRGCCILIWSMLFWQFASSIIWNTLQPCME